MMRRRRRFRSGGRSRRKKQWGGSMMWFYDADTWYIGAGGGRTQFIGNFWHKVPAGGLNTYIPPDSGEIEPTDWTLLRTFASWSFGFYLDQNAQNVQVAYNVGLICWDQIDDDNVLLEEQPIPGTDMAMDWIYHETVCDTYSASAAAHPALAYGNSISKQIDIRSKRKLSQGTGILMCWALDCMHADRSVDCTVRYNVNWKGRSLFALP